jgi:hypothetical protein
LQRDVDHKAVRCGAMPVVLAGLEEHAVAGAYFFDRSSLALAAPYALSHEDSLAQGVSYARRYERPE